MATQVTYKGSEIASFTNDTKTLKTSGKYLEGDISITDTSSAAAVVVTEEPDINGGVIKNITAVDISNDTVDAAHLLSGYTAHDGQGNPITGEYVAPPGSSWTKVAEKTLQYSTDSTTTHTIETWATGHSELWTSDKIVWVRIRDTEGKRNNYFYGSDSFLFNTSAANGSTTDLSFTGRRYAYYNSNKFYGGNSTYGIWCSTLSASGDITIQARYHSTSSRTINSAYKIEVYLLDPAGGILPFA